MSLYETLYRYLVSNALTVYYTAAVVFVFALNYLKNPFANPWAQKLRLEPPARLTDPKYGVHKYIKVNNTKLHYVESGDPSKPLMLFLHGFPEFWYSWRHQLVHFNKDFWCIAVDMRGYGDSEKPEGVDSYKMELLIEDVRDLVRHLGRDKIILVAHDWGGLIASSFRHYHPEVLSAVVLLGTASDVAWCNEVWTNPDQRKSSWYIFLFRAPVIPEKLFLMNDLAQYDHAMLIPGKDATDKGDVECYKYWFGKPSAITPPINYYRANFACVKQPRVYTGNVPMILIHGENDKYLNKNLLVYMNKEFPNLETIILENVGHFMQQEEPDIINTVIGEFVKKHNLLST